MDKFHTLDLLLLELNLDLSSYAYNPWSITKMSEIERHRHAIMNQARSMSTMPSFHQKKKAP